MSSWDARDGGPKLGLVASSMDPLFIVFVILLAVPAAYFLFARPTKRPREEGRPDSLERQELTGPEQHRRRKME